MDRKKLGHLHSGVQTHTHVIHRHRLLLYWTTRSNIHIQEESFSTNKLTEMAFLLLKSRVEALCMNHAILHSGVQRGPRLVYNEGRLFCRSILISFIHIYIYDIYIYIYKHMYIYIIWHNFVDDGSFLLLLFFKSLAFPCVAALFSTCCYFLFSYFT